MITQDDYDRLVAEHNAAVANGLIYRAARLARIIDSIERGNIRARR